MDPSDPPKHLANDCTAPTPIISLQTAALSSLLSGQKPEKRAEML